MKTVIEQLSDFIHALENKTPENYAPANLWIQDDIMRVYIRKGRHIIYPGMISTTLDIGAVEVVEEKQGEGHWTNFIAEAHKLNPWEATFIELVHNPDLFASLMRHGWLPVPTTITQAAKSFFMPKDTKKYYDQQYLKQKLNSDYGF